MCNNTITWIDNLSNKYVHEPSILQASQQSQYVCVSLSMKEVSRARFERTKGICRLLSYSKLGSAVHPYSWQDQYWWSPGPMSKFPRQEDIGKSQRYRLLSQYQTCSDMPFWLERCFLRWELVMERSAKVPPKRLKSSGNSLLVMLGSFPGWLAHTIWEDAVRFANTWGCSECKTICPPGTSLPINLVAVLKTNFGGHRRKFWTN